MSVLLANAKNLMKTLILTAIGALILFPVHNAAAQGKTYGDFKPNYKFPLKVVEVVSVEVSPVNPAGKKVKVPKGLPKYQKGQKVRFKIGRKGELIAPGAKIPFLTHGGLSNSYSRIVMGINSKTDTAIVFKNSNNEADNATLTFNRTSGFGPEMKSYTLTYKFE
jgi:hypothetical protein